MLYHFFKSATRNLWKNKGTSCINIGGLAIGMTAAILMMIWVNNERSFDSYHTDSKQLYRITTHIKANNSTWENSPLLLAGALRNEIPEIDKATLLSPNHWPVFTINEHPFFQKNAAFVDKDWFNTFTHEVKQGSVAAFNSHPNSIILAASEASKYFGTAPAIGKTILVDKLPYEVRAVVADPPVNSSFQYSAFLPVESLLRDSSRRKNDEQWSNYNYITFIKITPGSDKAVVEKKITALLQRYDKEEGVEVSLLSLPDMHFETGIFNSAFLHGNRNSVMVFSVLAFLLLLIASINYINLTTAKASLRGKEIGIRKINGASRSHLFWKFMAESLVISIVALVVTLVLVQLCLPLFNQLTGQSFNWSLLSPVLWKTAGATLVISFALNSVYPALLLSSFKPAQVFRGANFLKISNGYFRQSLVVFQFAVSVMLIVGSIIINRQLNFVQNIHLGYNRTALLSFALPPLSDSSKRKALMQTIRLQLQSTPGIQQVAMSNQPLVNIGSVCNQCADWEGRESEYHPDITQLSADTNFYTTMQLQMAEGAWYNSHNDRAQHQFVLNETAVRSFKLTIPVTGTRFIFKGDTGRVVGVVKDFSYQSMHEKIGPVVAFNDPRWQNYFTIRIAPLAAKEVIPNIEKIWKQHLPGIPLEYNFLDDSFNKFYRADQQTARLVASFALIALFISAMGLFSLASFAIAQRTREIGIRKVLGAGVAGIVTLVSKGFVRMVLLATLIASPVAWWATQYWLQNFAYRINTSWWVFALAGGIALLIALLTVSYQSVKAAIANPVKSLRTE